ncbi:MAG: hypothetical protein WCX65_08230 [bacterium]
MECKNELKENWEGKQVQVLGPCYEPGLAKGALRWKKNLETRGEFLAYLKQSERYWYAKNEGYGSEKRKNPA